MGNSIEVFEDEKETFLFLNGISVNRKITLRENVELLPVRCEFKPSEILDLSPNMGDYGVALIFLWLVKSQIHVIGDDPKALVGNAWNAQWDGVLLSAIFNCEAVCNFQSGSSAENISSGCHFRVTNHSLQGLSCPIYELREEDIAWIEQYYKIAWSLLEIPEFNNAVHLLASYRWHSLPNARLALIWSGIESLFNVDSEVVFKLSLFISRFLCADDELERKATFTKVKKLYNQRSRAIHGAILKKEPFTTVEESAELLRRLILHCVRNNGLPREEDLVP